jgi:hypothetical protein
MTWGRGFFRIWLFLSATWIGLSFYINEPMTYSWIWQAPRYEVKFASGHVTTFDTSKSYQELVADVTKELQREAERLGTPQAAPGGGMFDDLVSEADGAKRDQLLTDIHSRYETPGEQAKRAWLVTFIPPLALLGLGLSVACILRGFRARKSI